MRRGQVTIINMIAILAALVVSVVLMPILTNTIDAVEPTLNSTKYSLAIFIMSVLPAYLLIIIMIGALQYAQPRIER